MKKRCFTFRRNENLIVKFIYRFKKMSETAEKMKPLYTKCSLHGIAPVDNVWNRLAKELMQHLIT